jgi:antirestriction factor ArdC-like protein
MEGELCPSRPQGVSPGFRASLVQPFALLRPFHSRCAPLEGWEIPLSLQLLPPRLRQEAFGMYVHATARFKGKGQCDSQGGGIMNTSVTAAAVTPSTPNPNKQQKQTAKEVIAANVQALIEQLEQGHSEALTAYLTAMGRFHNYSFGNILEIAQQMPSASRVAGLYAWNHLGRRVKKGERGIRILAPLLDIKRKNESEAEREITKQNQPVLVGFRAVYVFDVSQTEGAELPDLKERVKGNVGDYRERLIDFILAQGIELEFKECIAPALGVSYGGKIAILPGQSAAEEFSTLVHEASHELLHKCSRRTATTKTVRETEAEAIAFVVSQTIGLDTGNAAADYIHLYHGNAALLAESLEVIQRTSAMILSAIETPAVMQEQTEEKPAEQPITTQDAAAAAVAEVA